MLTIEKTIYTEITEEDFCKKLREKLIVLAVRPSHIDGKVEIFLGTERPCEEISAGSFSINHKTFKAIIGASYINHGEVL
jgi:hypothetical protein